MRVVSSLFLFKLLYLLFVSYYSFSSNQSRLNREFVCIIGEWVFESIPLSNHHHYLGVSVHLLFIRSSTHSLTRSDGKDQKFITVGPKKSPSTARNNSGSPIPGYSLIHSLIHSVSHSLNHLFGHSFVQPFNHSCVIHRFLIQSLTHPPLATTVDLPLCHLRLLTHSFTHSLTCSLWQSLWQSLIHLAAH